MGKHNIGRYEKLMIFFNKEMKDNIPYSADDLLSLCKSIDSQADKTTIYNVTYKMKVANYIRSTEDKKYIKIPIAEKETVSLNDKVNDAIACIQKALSSYQSFNWLNCSESELLSTRQTFKALKKLSLYHIFNSSADGFASTIWRSVYTILFSSNHFFAF